MNEDIRIVQIVAHYKIVIVFLILSGVRKEMHFGNLQLRF